MEGRQRVWGGSAGYVKAVVEGSSWRERAAEEGSHSEGRAATRDREAVEAAKALSDQMGAVGCSGHMRRG